MIGRQAGVQVFVEKVRMVAHVQAAKTNFATGEAGQARMKL
jgi:hypothetical protein